VGTVGDDQGCKGEANGVGGGSRPSNDSPPNSGLRRLAQKASVSAGFVGLTAGTIWLPDTLIAPITKGVMFVVLAVLVFLGAVLFSNRSEPADRLIKIIKAARKV
jgi:hypothetical protein